MTADLKGMTAVITAGGIGTRLLPFSKEIPKEMCPILTKDSSDNILVKPIIQAIFEQLYDCGIRDFFTVVGRGKRAIEDHFTPDQGFLEILKSRGKKTDVLDCYYKKLSMSNIVFIMQPQPLGFGDAVLKTKRRLLGEFLVHAGDTYIISEDDSYLSRLKAAHAVYNADVTVLLKEVSNPRHYGVVVGEELSEGIVRIEKAIEKPELLVSKLAIMPAYIFNHSIFDALENTPPGKGGEIQLTDAIQLLISQGRKVLGVQLTPQDIMLDIGTPETLIEALWMSSRYMSRSFAEPVVVA